MNYAILCDTPYQILSAISFKLDRTTNGDRVDLFVDVLRCSNVDMVSLAFRVKESKIFTNVYCIENLQIKYERFKPCIRVLEWLFPATIYNLMTKKITRKCKYDITVVSGPFSTQRCLIAAFPKSEIYFIEDGLGSYIGRNGIRELSWRGKIAQRIFKFSPIHIYPKVSFLYFPAFYEGEYKHLVQKMAFPVQCKKKLNEIFEINCSQIKNIYKNRQFVYFSQYFGSDKEMQIEQSIVNIIKDFKKDFVVRPHPRGVCSFYEGLYIDNSFSQWELSYAEIDNESVLIGNFSTALFVPKLIYDKEPTIIFTYKLYGNNFVSDAVNRLRNLYTNKQKIICVTSVDDFLKIITELREGTNCES